MKIQKTYPKHKIILIQKILKLNFCVTQEYWDTYLILLVFFFVYNNQEQLVSILYEVKNTFGEQHTYVFRVDDKNNLIKNNCSKKFHVSPFIEMDCQYFFRILKPEDKLSVIIDQYDKDGKILFASQDGVRNDLNSKQLIKSYIKHP